MDALQSVSVVSRHGVCPGVRRGDLLAYDWAVPDDDPRLPERGHVQRIFVSIGESVQVQCPFWLAGDFAGWWYVDLIAVEDHGATVTLRDMYVDFLVAPSGPDYRIIDLEELGAALAAGTVTTAQAASTLAATQAYADAHLQTRGELPGDFPDFPPRALGVFEGVPALTGSDVRGAGGGGAAGSAGRCTTSGS